MNRAGMVRAQASRPKPSWTTHSHTDQVATPSHCVMRDALCGNCSVLAAVGLSELKERNEVFVEE